MPNWEDVDTSAADGGWASLMGAARVDRDHKEAIEEEMGVDSLNDFYNAFSEEKTEDNFHKKA